MDGEPCEESWFCDNAYKMGGGGCGYSAYEDEIYQGVLFRMFVIVASPWPFCVCKKLAVQCMVDNQTVT